MKKKQTAAELIAELNTDNEYLEMRKTQEAARKDLAEKRKGEVELVISALNESGISVRSIESLAENKDLQKKSIPVLINQLKVKHPDHVRESIMRGLANPFALDYWTELVRSFEENSFDLSSEIRYVAGLVLAEAANDSVLDDVIRLLRKKDLGHDRVPLLLALIRSKSPKARMTLMELRSDSELGKEIKRFKRLERLQRHQGN